jgi:hypothetical protein
MNRTFKFYIAIITPAAVRATVDEIIAAEDAAPLVSAVDGRLDGTAPPAGAGVGVAVGVDTGPPHDMESDCAVPPPFAPVTAEDT